MKNNWEIAGRYTNVNANDLYDNNDLNQYTIGFSKYVVGHNLKVQTDLVILLNKARMTNYYLG